MVRRYAAPDVSSWPVAAARRDESRVVALQYAARPAAVALRYVAPHAGPSLDAVVGEPHGMPARRVAPLPEALLGAPSPVVVPLDGPWQAVLLDGPLAQPRLLGRGLLLGRTTRCSPQSRRRQEKMLQRERIAKA